MRLINPEKDVVRGFRLSMATRTAPDYREIAVEPFPDPAAGIDARIRPVSRLVGRFIDWVERNVPANPSFQAGLRVQRLVEAAQESEKSGRWVDCSQVMG